MSNNNGKRCMRTTRTHIIGMMVFAIAISPFAHCQTASKGDSTRKMTPVEAQQIALDAYIYGYPLITMEFTRRVMTNMQEVVGTRGPMGHLIKLRAYPTAAFKDVTAPNADTLYTTAWLDVGKEPWVLS